MPKRSNDFQKLVYLVQRNLANGARVTESRMMRDRLTKGHREVDVVIEGKVGGQSVSVSIECRDHKRIADVTWVDAMKSKHERLPTNALFLASRSGFTTEARTAAEQYGIQLFTLEDIESADISSMLAVGGSLWAKSIAISVARVRVIVGESGELPLEAIDALPDNLMYLDDGVVIATLREQVEILICNPSAQKYLLSEANDEHNWLEFRIANPTDGQGRRLYMKSLVPDRLRLVEAVHVIGPCKVAIGRFGMRRAKLGNVEIAWGKTSVGGHDLIAVANMTEDGKRMLSVDLSAPSGRDLT